MSSSIGSGLVLTRLAYGGTHDPFLLLPLAHTPPLLAAALACGEDAALGGAMTAPVAEVAEGSAPCGPGRETPLPEPLPPRSPATCPVAAASGARRGRPGGLQPMARAVDVRGTAELRVVRVLKGAFAC